MRLVDADALDKTIYEQIPIKVFGTVKRMAAMREIIQNAPTVDAVPVKHGRWEQVFEERTIHGLHCSAPNFRCSACKKWWFHNGECVKWMKYCPECGAKMDGEKVSE